MNLQEVNIKVTTNIANDEFEYISPRLLEVLDTVQDLSADIVNVVSNTKSGT